MQRSIPDIFPVSHRILHCPRNVCGLIFYCEEALQKPVPRAKTVAACTAPLFSLLFYPL